MRFVTGSFSRKRVVLFCLLAVLVGYCASRTLSLLMPLLLCLLYAGGGVLPLLTGAIVTCSTFAFLGGAAGALMAFIALILPALLTVGALMSGASYPKQLRISIAGHVGGVLVLLALAGLMTGGQLAGSLTEYVRQTLQAFPTAAQDAFLITAYPSLSPSGTLISLTSAVRARYLEDFLMTMESTLALELLPMLLTTSLLSAGLASYLPARALRLRGQISGDSFLPLSQWFLPGQATVGILLTTLAAYLLNRMGVAGADVAYLSMYSIMCLVFAAQGLAAMDRMLCASRGGIVRKTLLLGAMFLFAQMLVTAAGLCSALLGRRGLLRRFRDHFHKEDDQP